MSLKLDGAKLYCLKNQDMQQSYYGIYVQAKATPVTKTTFVRGSYQPEVKTIETTEQPADLLTSPADATVPPWWDRLAQVEKELEKNKAHVGRQAIQITQLSQMIVGLKQQITSIEQLCNSKSTFYAIVMSASLWCLVLYHWIFETTYASIIFS